MADAVDTVEALAVAREAAAAARRVLRDAGPWTGRPAAAEKNPWDLVTETDHRSEEQIVERLSRAFPDHAIVAEESGGSGGRGPYRWIVDPLDGTANYVHGFPMFAVSIALYEDDDPRVAVVVDPVRDEWFTARSGAGAWVDGGDPGAAERLAVASEPAPERALLATGFPFRRREELDRYLGAFRELFVRVSDMRRAGSAALDLAYVAAGRLDGFWELGLSPWDIAAGELLIAEAGGRTTDWSGGPGHRRSGWVAAGSPAVHALLVATLERHA